VKLYYFNPGRAIRPRWVLEEIGAPYELVRVDLAAGEQKRPEYLAINPTGTVPALVDGDLKLFESAAICQYLADKYPGRRLAPPLGTPARGLYYQWIHFAMSSLDPTAITLYHHTTFLPEAERIAAIAEDSRRRLLDALAVLNPTLVGREYIVGEEFSVADVVVASTLAWVHGLGLIAPAQRATADYLARMVARPAYQRANAD
jgi:glutathione S-transferase